MRPGYRAMLTDRMSVRSPTAFRLVTPHTVCECMTYDEQLVYLGQAVEWELDYGEFTYRCGNTMYHVADRHIDIRGTNGHISYERKFPFSKFLMELFRGPIRFSVHVDHPGEEDELGIEIVARESVIKKFSIPFDWNANPLQLVAYAIQLINMM